MVRRALRQTRRRLIATAYSTESAETESNLEQRLLRSFPGAGRPTAKPVAYGGSHVYIDETGKAVQESGFRSASTTHAGVVTENCDRFLLPRVTVLDWGGEPFAERLANWFDRVGESGAHDTATGTLRARGIE